jgi:hypothetical protein
MEAGAKKYNAESCHIQYRIQYADGKSSTSILYIKKDDKTEKQVDAYLEVDGKKIPAQASMNKKASYVLDQNRKQFSDTERNVSFSMENQSGDSGPKPNHETISLILNNIAVSQTDYEKNPHAPFTKQLTFTKTKWSGFYGHKEVSTSLMYNARPVVVPSPSPSATVAPAPDQGRAQ